jgi:hypothetical protein
MERTFATEDDRKTELFKAWIEYLSSLHSPTDDDKFEEIFEGLATVSDLSKNRLGLHLEDGRKLRHIHITPEIGRQSCRLDSMYLALGLRDGQWRALNIISVASLIFGNPQKVHITFNPLYVDAMHTQ